MTKSIRIGIAEDHDILRQTLSKLLQGEPNLMVVVEASNGKELLDKMKDEAPLDVVLLDLKMPVMDGKATLKALTKLGSVIQPAVIILSMHYSEEHIRKYIGLGANAFLSKGTEYPTLLCAIEDVHATGYHFDKRVTKELVTEIIKKSSKFANSIIDTPLSEREIEVLRLICHQKTNLEISKVLDLSQRTVENHRMRIMKKIGAKTSIGLLIYAMKNDLTDIESL